VQKNIDFVAEQNGISVPEVIERHTGTEFWVVCVGFTPGCYFSFPLDDTKRLTAPKWKTPRDYTPARMLALAGFSTGAYPVASPGGYQLLGRLAANIYEPVPKNRAFPADGVLLRAGDRMRYFAVDALEYDDIWSAVEAGEYEYDIEEGTFDVGDYVARRVTAPVGETV
jgi:inhibitor of KinA